VPALKEAPRRHAPSDGDRPGRLFDPGGNRSLDEAVRGLVDGAGGPGRLRCLVCGSALERTADPALLECRSCGTTLE
jgi:hypothetical protein